MSVKGSSSPVVAQVARQRSVAEDLAAYGVHEEDRRAVSRGLNLHERRPFLLRRMSVYHTRQVLYSSFMNECGERYVLAQSVLDFE
jgi:hypothetical protein